MAKNYIDSMLGQSERIILVTRQHGFVLFSSIIAEIVVTLIVIAAISVMTALVNLLAAWGFILLLIPLAIMTWDILAWNNRQYVVTNRRVIQISGVFNKDVIDSSLEKVTDIKMAQTFIGRLFDFGDIEILTASEIGVNLFKRIGNPIRFKTAMLNAKEKLGFEGTGNHAQHAESIPEMIAKLDVLRKQGIVTDAEFQAKKKELLAKM